MNDSQVTALIDSVTSAPVWPARRSRPAYGVVPSSNDLPHPSHHPNCFINLNYRTKVVRDALTYGDPSDLCICELLQ